MVGLGNFCVSDIINLIKAKVEIKEIGGKDFSL